ncbi:alpha-(1-_3)-arabinofuranosyltransferase [Lentzea albida]|uniref:Arabinofuranan 3-O-arabinosyltransferase n=1 Tax=Lentzea albida TaxID=65499 RepID=A0A1H9MJM5_9PSEU|nr:alpha-(1->3)-arabinofuranosyltransferase [Lentzea albida]SER23828.1 arabinofuranan 3-O-arabinosyltransferase [Lentzea albida]
MVTSCAITSLKIAHRNPTTWVLLALAVLSFAQRFGQTTFDTKLDLVVNPVGFLGRALHLWNPEATAGELQNQAYGYFFPMGPFFAAGQVLGIPAWITQRLWCALLLCLAFYGVLRLARALGIGQEPTRYAGALAYALAPRVLTEIGPLSSEMLPAVMLPWVLLPLVLADRIGSPRRAAALSALAVLGMGGINGAMVVMALVLPGIWLLTRRWNRAHVRLVLWWAASVIAVALWWIVPLLLLGRYSLPFLDYIESAANTTSPMSLFQVLRGTNQWVAYVLQGEPWWPNGFLLVDNPVLMAGTAAVALIGVVGLARLGLPERRFLVLGTLTGLTLLTVGYVGSLDSPLAETVRGLLDGPLAPLRNVHKFEPVLRLCLVLGFVHGLHLSRPAGVRAAPEHWRRRVRTGVVLLLIAVVAAPAWLLTLRPGLGWSDVPGHWREAAAWLAEKDGRAKTLLLPANGFGQYTWGRTVDEPMQSLAEAPWAVRNQIPLGSEGNTRFMDAVHDALADGRGSAGLADFLARGGYRFLLLRNDIAREPTGAPPLTVMRQALQGSPGIERVAEFGPEVRMSDQRLVSSVDVTATGRSLEVFEVKRPVPVVSAVNAADVPTVSGGPESLLPLLSQGLLKADQPAILAGDAAEGSAELLVTDGLRRKERNVGRVSDNLSQTMSADEASRQGRVALDVSPFQDVRHQTVAEYRGIRAVRASTSTAYADAAGTIDPANSPFAAVDGDGGSAWHSSSFTGPVGQWLEIDLDTPRSVGEVTLDLVDDLRVGWAVTRIRITTDTGATDHDVPSGGGPHAYPVSPGLTGSVRVTVLGVAADRQDGNVGVKELSVPGMTAQRALRVPRDREAAEPGFSFTRGSQSRPACYRTGDAVRCDSSLSRFGEEVNGLTRLFRTSAAGRFVVNATVVPAAGARNPVAPDGVTVTGTSSLAGDVAASPLSAVDGDVGTAWVPDVTDLRPTLTLAWQGKRTVSEFRVEGRKGSRTPVELEVRTDAGTEVVRVGADGLVTIRPADTEKLELVVRESGGAGPAEIGELRVPALDGVLEPVPADTPFTVPCGRGPVVDVDGVKINSSVSGVLGDVVNHRPLKAVLCDDDLATALELPAGDHVLSTSRSDSFVVQDVSVTHVGLAQPVATHREVTIGKWDATDRRVTVAPGARALLVVPENVNDGWTATLNGQVLEKVRVDGWQQAYVLPGGDGGVVALEFGPDTRYRTGLLVGALGVLAVLLLAAIPVRRRVAFAAPSESRWPVVAMLVLLAVLGGMLPIVAVIACLLAREFWAAAPKVIAVGGMALGSSVAVLGRILGHGQEWAYVPVAQAALLVAVSAVVAAAFRPFGRRDERSGEEKGGEEQTVLVEPVRP